MLTAVRPSGKRGLNREGYWWFRCDCGNEKEVRASSFTGGRTKSCGCFRKRNIAAGMVWGCLTAVKQSDKKNSRGIRTYWLFKCACGTMKDIDPYCVAQGQTKSCGCKSHRTKGPRKDLTGRVFNKLTVLRLSDEVYTQPSTGHVYYKWECQCVCGRVITLDVGRLRNQKSCGCVKYRTGRDNPLWRGCGGISGHTWNSWRQGAKSRGIDFTISINYGWDVFLSQDGKCALTGLNLHFSSGQSRGCREKTASLDRIDSTKGYIEGNVQWVHKDINVWKMDLDEDYFIELCRAVANHADAKERGLAV